MPTLPLYTTAAAADASHRVTSPGGYEWWYFDAEDPATDTRLVAILLDGFVFHPAYLHRYFAYRRHPTRRAPPLPSEYPCAYFVVYRGGRVLAQFMTQYPAGAFDASADAPHVRLGPNRMELDDGGRYQLHLHGVPWHLTWRGPQRPSGGELSADLTFAPRWPRPPHERPFFSRALTGADHRWVIAAPLCDVTGAVRLRDPAGDETVTTFTGRGYHDHNYGAAPLGPGLRRWTWGRVLFDDRALLFHVAEPRDPRMTREAHLLEATAAGVTELDPAHVQLQGHANTAVGLPYPTRLTLGPLADLAHPRPVDVSPFYLRLTYGTSTSVGDPLAFCEVAYPHRLRWPILRHMISMSIHRQDA